MEPRDDGYRSLPTGEPARRWLAQEDARLTEFFEHQLGIAAADGGRADRAAAHAADAEQWQAARSAFIDVGSTTAV
jgi:hypothetical protein